MKVSVIENSPTVLRADITGIDYSFANALRRSAMVLVECMAVDTVTFYENTSAMFDEYIAERIGLVPLLTPKGYTEKDEIVFALEGEGPLTLYSKDMKSSDKEVSVANGNIPIIKLGEGQRLRADCKAVLANGKRSAKFQPGIVSYKTTNNKDFEFYIESFGQMPANEILKRALVIIGSGLKDAYKELKK